MVFFKIILTSEFLKVVRMSAPTKRRRQTPRLACQCIGWIKIDGLQLGRKAQIKPKWKSADLLLGVRQGANITGIYFSYFLNIVKNTEIEHWSTRGQL